MNVNTRDGRDAVGQRAPRSGGRIAAQRTTPTATAGDDRQSVRSVGYRREGRLMVDDRLDRQEATRARGAREFPTQGTAALRPERKRPARTASPRLRVAPPPPVRVPRAPFAGLILVLVVGGVFGILAINTKINENAFKRERLQQEQARLDVDQQQLEKEIAEQKAPGNLIGNVRRLGLVDPGEPAYIRLPDGKIIGVPHPADGAPAITSQQGNGG